MASFSAAAGHALMAWNLDVAEKDAIPTEAQVIAQYDALTGCVTAGDAHDTGLAETDVLNDWHTTGLFGGNKIAAYAPVAHANILDIHQAIDAYGVCYVGVNLPQSAETQFENNQPWTLEGDAAVGGHAFPLVGYDATFLYCVTWGAIQAISIPWWSFYAEEAYAIVPQAFVEAKKGPTLDLASLQADLDSMNVTPPKKKPKKPPWWSWFGSLFR